MDYQQPPSLSAQLLVLKTQHRALDQEIDHLQCEYPHNDQLYLQRLKRQKLRIKENILVLQSMLIPDLDA
ncbi:MAG: hypothetical protein ACI9WS_000004 [Paraglaciecola psychrophila]|jgi:hypothetical protein